MKNIWTMSFVLICILPSHASASGKAPSWELGFQYPAYFAKRGYGIREMLELEQRARETAFFNFQILDDVLDAPLEGPEVEMLGNCEKASAEADEVPLILSTRKICMCKIYKANGKCHRKVCTFAHGENDLAPNPWLKTKLCNKFAKRGECPKGEHCRYAH